NASPKLGVSRKFGSMSVPIRGRCRSAECEQSFKPWILRYRMESPPLSSTVAKPVRFPRRSTEKRLAPSSSPHPGAKRSRCGRRAYDERPGGGHRQEYFHRTRPSEDLLHHPRLRSLCHRQLRVYGTSYLSGGVSDAQGCLPGSHVSLHLAAGDSRHRELSPQRSRRAHALQSSVKTGSALRLSPWQASRNHRAARALH